MKSLIQTYLIGAGAVGFVFSLPVAGYGWMMHSGFGGDLTGRDRLILFSPVICAVAIVIGVCWKRADQKRNRPSADTAADLRK